MNEKKYVELVCGDLLIAGDEVLTDAVRDSWKPVVTGEVVSVEALNQGYKYRRRVGEGSPQPIADTRVETPATPSDLPKAGDPCPTCGEPLKLRIGILQALCMNSDCGKTLVATS